MGTDATASTPAVFVTGLRKGFSSARMPETEVLHGIDLAVARGEMVSIVGPSGSGKSTLLACLAGLEPPSAGTVTLAGHDLGRLSPSRLARLRRDRVGFVFQSYNLIPALTAGENVLLPARLRGQKVTADDARRALADVGLEGKGAAFPANLSGGQQQRVAVARAVFATPDVVFADEPTGALDAKAGETVLRLLRAATGAGSAVVLVTHDLDAAALADRAVVLRDGVVHHELVRPTASALFDIVSAAA